MQNNKIIISNQSFELFQIDKCNLQVDCKCIYPIKGKIPFCPQCTNKLIENFCIAIKVDSSSCIKIKGGFCTSCKSLYLVNSNPEFLLEVKKYDSNNSKFEIKYDYINCDENIIYDYVPILTTNQELFTYNGDIQCHKKHHLCEFHAIIPALSGQIGFYVEYCYECKKFLMKFDDYQCYLRKFGFFPLKINVEKTKLNSFQRAEFSPLRLQGYCVNQNENLSKETRQKILMYILDYRILSKRKVLNYLEMFIKENENSFYKSLAVSKWKEDLNFVLNYKQKEKPLVNIAKISKN